MSDVRDLRPYEELREALDARAETVWPSRDALFRVRTTARRRRRRRRVTIGGCALVATTVAFASVGGSLHEANRAERSAVSSPASRARVGTAGAAALRTLYGIVGTTKGAAAPARSLPEAPPVVGPRQTGGSVSIPGDAASTSVAPGHTTVAVVTKQQQVVVESTVSGSSKAVLGRTTSGAQVSWAPGGTALFAFVGKHWVRVPSADGTENPRAHAQALSVPRVAGGPTFLSLSPGKDVVVLFGVTRARGGTDPRPAVPHAYIGRFDGADVTHVRRIGVPAAATGGPLGWLGDNAFVVAAGPGRAWIVRVHGSPVTVRAAIPDVCSLAGAPAACISDAPRLLGTDAAGALLYWEVRVESPAAPANGSSGGLSGNAPAGAATVDYFSTWLDGSHSTRLTGAAGTYGPTLAAR